MDHVARIELALADLGTIHRRAGSETLNEIDFRSLMNRIRRQLQTLRAELQAEDADPADFALTEAGQALADRNPTFAGLIAGLGLMTARDLAEGRGPPRTRAWTRGNVRLGVIDGGRA